MAISWNNTAVNNLHTHFLTDDVNNSRVFFNQYENN